MNLKEMAEILYDISLDMDFADYAEHTEIDIENLIKELKVLQENNCSALLNIIETIIERNENVESA